MERDCEKANAYLLSEISTHTLTWSVTVFLKDILAKISNFNSHAHVERDDEITAKRYTKEHFNSHAHVERDVLLLDVQPLLQGFQLTRSRGA